MSEYPAFGYNPTEKPPMKDRITSICGLDKSTPISARENIQEIFSGISTVRSAVSSFFI